MTAPAAHPGQELTKAAAQARETEAPRALAAVPQYATGFEGAAAAPFSPEAVAVLGAPVAEDEVELRDDGIVFMPGIWYRRQLSRAFGPGAWALLPRGPSRRDGDVVLYHGGLYVLGRFVSEAMGECEARFGMTYASALEGARTDCLSRCCKDLGMAAELWDKAWRDGWLAKYSVKEWRDGKEGRKGRYVFSRVGAKKGAVLIEGRNAGGAPDPKGHGADGPAAPSNAPMPARTSAESAAGATGATSAEPTSQPDTGESPSDELIHELQAAAVALKWKGPRAKNWLKKHFGVDAANALTRRQAEDALSLLKAAAVDDMDKSYGELMDALLAAGRVSA